MCAEISLYVGGKFKGYASSIGGMRDLIGVEPVRHQSAKDFPDGSCLCCIYIEKTLAGLVSTVDQLGDWRVDK